MLSKRDKILVRPWEQRKYENHIHKVQTALPVIDNKPPVTREHVSVKLKKRQKEIERIRRIENENLILLRKMNYIMKTSRVDNYWTKPLPNFLNRVSMYDKIERPTTEVIFDFREPEPPKRDHVKKSKCTACTPQPITPKPVPEERVPWDPPKQPVGRVRSKSVPVRKNSLPTILEKQKPKTAEKPKSSGEIRTSSGEVRGSTGPTFKQDNPKHLKRHRSYEDCYSNPQKLVLTRGSLKLCVNFPSDTKIKLHDGIVERTILKPNCGCKRSANVS